MSKSNNNGYGDGTNWSSEKGNVPQSIPGNESRGNQGGNNSQNTGDNENNDIDQQILNIQRDTKVKQRLTDLYIAARKINSAAKMTLGSISPDGMMQVNIEGLTAAQGKQIGLIGLVMGLEASGYVGVLGSIDTGHRLETQKVTIPRSETSIDGFLNGQKSVGGWSPVAEDNWTGTGPLGAAQVNNAIKSVRITRQGYMTGILTPEEAVNKAEYKAMLNAFNSLPLSSQGTAVKQIISAWSLAWQDFAEHLKKDMGRITERVVDTVNLAYVLNQTASKLAESQKSVDVANQLINEITKTINDINRKVADKKKQQATLANLMNVKSKEVEDLKKLFKNHAYHRIQDAQKAYDDAQKQHALLQNDINALNSQIPGLETRKQQASRNKEIAEKAKKDAAARAAAEKSAAEAKAKADAAKAKKKPKSKQKMKRKL